MQKAKRTSEVYYNATKDRFVARFTRFYENRNQYVYEYLGNYKLKEDAYTAINTYVEKRKKEKKGEKLLLVVNIDAKLVKQLALEINIQNKFKYKIVEDALKMYFSNKEGYISKDKIIKFIKEDK